MKEKEKSSSSVMEFFRKLGIKGIVGGAIVLGGGVAINNKIESVIEIRESDETIGKLNNLYGKSAQEVEGFLGKMDKEKLKQALLKSYKDGYGAEHRVHSVVMSNIYLFYGVREISKWEKELRLYFVSLGITGPEMLGLENSDVVGSGNEVLRIRYDKSIEKKKVIINEELLKKNSKKMLIMCDNNEEKGYFMENMKKFKGFEKHLDEGVLVYKNGNKNIYVVTHVDLEKVPKGKFGIIELKGHGSAMSGGISAVKEFIDEGATVVLLGGCSSNHETRAVLDIGGLPITNKGVGVSAHNDYMVMRLFTLLNESSMESLEDTLDKIKGDAKITSKRYFYPNSSFTQKFNSSL